MDLFTINNKSINVKLTSSDFPLTNDTIFKINNNTYKELLITSELLNIELFKNTWLIHKGMDLFTPLNNIIEYLKLFSYIQSNLIDHSNNFDYYNQIKQVQIAKLKNK